MNQDDRQPGFWQLLDPEIQPFSWAPFRLWTTMLVLSVLHVAAMGPFAFLIHDPAEVPRNGPTMAELIPMASLFAVLPVLALLQPWIGYIKLTKLPRPALAVVLLPLLLLLGLLSIPVGIERENVNQSLVGAASAVAAFLAWRWQILLWRRQALEVASP